MAEITAAMVKQLRDDTQLPMMECKKALVESSGDQEAAEGILRKKMKGKMDTRSETSQVSRHEAAPPRYSASLRGRTERMGASEATSMADWMSV